MTQTPDLAPLRVAHYLWNAAVGGIERLVLDLATCQLDGGHVAPAVVFGKDEGDFRHLFDGHAEIESAGLSSGADMSPRAIARLVRAFRRADVVHLHSFHPAAALAAVRAGVPVVFTEHGVFGRTRESTLARHTVHALKGAFLRHGVDVLTFNSAYTRHTSLDQYRLGPARPRQAVVFNGTRLDPVVGVPDADVAARCTGRFVVGTASRMDGQKRLDRLIDAFAQLDDPDAVLLLVGDGPERAALQRHADALGDRVIWTGYKSPATPYQQLMDVCVLPSEREAFGLTTVEAFALGLPAIVFDDAGGAVEVVQPLEPADVVHDVDGLAARLAHYRDAGTGDADARRHWAGRFGVQRMTDAFEALYREVCAAPAPNTQPVLALQ